ncbi:hypothetical protein QJQ45_009195 [Haematococcus lacustris]|nr:hypothetical protein QJQ45_009195 [Haematococcus lacustris]
MLQQGIVACSSDGFRSRVACVEGVPAVALLIGEALHLAAASSADTSLVANLQHFRVTLATLDAVWEVYPDPQVGTAVDGAVQSPGPGAGAVLQEAWSQQRDQPVRAMMWCPVVAPSKPHQAPCSSQAATQLAASEPQGKATKAKPPPQPGRWVDRDCNAALNMQRIGESRWLDWVKNPCVNFQRMGREGVQRPLEMCSWKGLEGAAPLGKEHQQGFELVNDPLPKARQRLNQAGEHRRRNDA